jgi:hypothetical protein
MDEYSLFIEELALDVIVAVFNFIDIIMFILTLTSIAIVFIGNHIIKCLKKLEIKYSKLAKYIEIKKFLNKHYLVSYIEYIIITFSKKKG